METTPGDVYFIPWPLPVVSPTGGYGLLVMTLILIVMSVRVFWRVRSKPPSHIYFVACVLPLLIAGCGAFLALAAFYEAWPDKFLEPRVSTDFRRDFMFFSGAFRLAGTGSVVSTFFTALGLLAAAIHASRKRPVDELRHEPNKPRLENRH